MSGKDDLEKLVPETQTTEINGVEIEVPPFKNDSFLTDLISSRAKGKDESDLYFEMCATVLNENEEFEGVTGDDLRDSRVPLMSLIMKIMDVSGMEDFSDEEELQKVMEQR